MVFKNEPVMIVFHLTLVKKKRNGAKKPVWRESVPAYSGEFEKNCGVKDFYRLVKMGDKKDSPVVEQMISVIDLPYKTPLNDPAIMALYERLGFECSTFTLGWDTTKQRKTMKGACLNRTLKEPAKHTGYQIWLDTSNAEIIDIDAPSDEAKHIIKLALNHCQMIVETRKGYHLYFKNQHNFDSQINGKYHIDLLTANGTSPTVILAPPSSYIIPADNPKQSSSFIRYKLLTYPDGELTPMSDELVAYLRSLGFYAPGKKPAPEPEPAHTPDPDDGHSIISTTTNKTPNYENIDALCDCLTPNWLNETMNWLKLAYCLKAIKNDEATKELFINTASRGTNYGDEATRRSNAKHWDSIKPNNRLTIWALQNWARLCDPKKYFSNAKNDYLRLLLSSPTGQPSATQICELFINEMAGDIIYSTSDKDFYIYDPSTTIWKGGNGVRATIHQIFVDTLHRVIIKIMDGLSQDDTGRTIRQRLLKVMRQTDGNAAVATVANFLPSFCLPPDGTDPLSYFNQNPDLLPLLNGVWKFSEKKLIPYEREHFFTHKIDIKYNPSADTSLIRRAMNDWFKGDTETINHIQYIIGYLLTGFVGRQEFMVAWGSEAGNGKSVLWGEIVPGLVGDKYYARITSDAFADTNNPNNDQLYYLNGVRYAFMSEPRKHKIDNEVLKTVTGDKDFTAQAKYKNKLTFKLSVKIVCACNDLPEFNCDDKGTMRRFVPFLQNVACLDTEDYENAPANLKADRSVLLKDDDFIKQLLADKEGTLRWALEGATNYINDPRKEAPQSMRNTKMKAKETIDTLTAWLSGNLEKGDKPLNFSAIKTAWREKQLDFQQTKKGFAGRLMNKIRMLGFTVDEGRSGKSEERVLNCRLVPDKYDGQID